MAAAAAKKQADQERFQAMEEARRELNTFLKANGFERGPVAPDGNCVYLAILASLGVLTPEEVKG